MKKYSLYIIIALSSLLVLNSFNSEHEYFVSICNVKCYPASKELGISIKFTAHDIENAILKESKIDLHLGEKKQHPKTDSLLNNYILDKFIVESDKKINLKYIGNQFSLDETLIVYFEAKDVNLTKLTIENTLLTEIFNRQENVVHVELFKKIKTYSFNKINTNHTFNLIKL